MYSMQHVHVAHVTLRSSTGVPVRPVEDRLEVGRGPEKQNPLFPPLTVTALAWLLTFN